MMWLGSDKSDRGLPSSPFSIIDIEDDSALEEIIDRSRDEDKRNDIPYPPVPLKDFEIPFIPPPDRRPEPEQPRVYIEDICPFDYDPTKNPDEE
jgi:hypothetical protein